MNELTELTKKQPVPLEIRVLKLVEEVGELSRAVIISRGSKHSDGSAAESLDMIKEEVVDVYMLVHSLLCDVFGDAETQEMTTMLEKKIKKWRSKFD